MVNFQAVLINTKFDIDCRNVLRFDTREAQESYFDVASLFLTAQSVNFNAGSLIETTIIYRAKDTESVNDLLSKNYCIIKDNSTNATLKYYYYFVKNIIQDSGNQLKVWLELDIFQTYYIDMTFTDCEILKAHLNRFVDNGDDTVSFDGRVESKLFEREEVQNVSKRLKSRKKVSLYQNITNMTQSVQEWIDENVLCWVYVYLDSSHGFDIIQADGSTAGGIRFLETKIHTIGNNGSISTKLTAACVPILKSGKNFRIDATVTFPQTTYSIFIGQNVLERFMNNNDGSSFIYSMKISANHPFYNLNNSTTWTISGDGNTLTLGGNFTINQGTGFSLGRDYSNGDTHVKMTDYQAGWGLIYVEDQQASIEASFSTSFQYTFNKNEIVGAQKNSKFNPKLLSSDFASVNVGNENSNFEYDAQKLNKNNLKALYSEPLAADITKTYIRYEGEENAIYNEETSKNFTGDVNSNDTSLVQVTTAYQNMLANNKNYFLQNTINRGLDVGKGLISTGFNIATGNIFGAISSGIGSIVSPVADLIKQKLTIDNMKAAPSAIQNAKGNILLNLMSSELGLIVEEYEILPNEKEIINDFMCQFGFTVNQIGNIKDFDNIRKFYNYVKAEIQETGGINISKTVHDKFKEFFARGVRFWNNDNFSYAQENYERWLES